MAWKHPESNWLWQGSLYTWGYPDKKWDEGKGCESAGHGPSMSRPCTGAPMLENQEGAASLQTQN